MAIELPKDAGVDTKKPAKADVEKKVAESKGTEIVPIDDKSLQKMQFSSDEFKELFQTEVQASMNGVIPRLPQIRISRETGQFIFPDDELKKEFTGIIIHSQKTKAYWDEDFKGDGKPPTCASLNAITPTQWEGENPIHDKCKTCPMNKFGTATNDKGQKTKGKACRDLRRIHIITNDGSMLPYRLTLPPTSLENYDDYVTKLVSKNTPIIAVITKFMTVPGKSGGYDISKFKGEFVDIIAHSQDAFEQKFYELKHKKDFYAPVMMGQAVEAEEYPIDTEGGSLENGTTLTEPPVVESSDPAPF